MNTDKVETEGDVIFILHSSIRIHHCSSSPPIDADKTKTFSHRGHREHREETELTAKGTKEKQEQELNRRDAEDAEENQEQ